jgi:hypothetical protein
MTFGVMRRVWRRAAAASTGKPAPGAPRGLTSDAAASSTLNPFKNHQLQEFAQQNDVGLHKKLTKVEMRAEETRFGIKAYYHRQHQVNQLHTEKLDILHPLTPMLESIYRTKKKNPLWTYFHEAEFESKSYVRTSAKMKCRRALLGALKASGYRPNGKALAAGSVRGTELRGTIKILVFDPQVVARVNIPMLIEYLTSILKNHLIPKLRREVGDTGGTIQDTKRIAKQTKSAIKSSQTKRARKLS